MAVYDHIHRGGDYLLDWLLCYERNVVPFGEEELEYNYVADVEEVHDKLMKLRLTKTEG